MVKRAQALCHAMGEGACYFLSLLIAAERENKSQLRDGAVELFSYFLAKGMVKADCTVMDGAGIMVDLCVGGPWQVLKAGDGKDSAGRDYDLPLDYQLQPGEYDVHRFEKKVLVSPGNELVKGHFFYAAPGPLEDPYGESDTRTNGGHLVSRRILRRRG